MIQKLKVNSVGRQGWMQDSPKREGGGGGGNGNVWPHGHGKGPCKVWKLLPWYNLLLPGTYIRCVLTVSELTCKIMQDCTRILHARLAWHVHAICPFSCTILAGKIFLQHLLQNLAPFLARYVQDCARIMQEKGHIACMCQANLACKVLAQSCMILQVRFCWEGISWHFAPCQKLCVV